MTPVSAAALRVEAHVKDAAFNSQRSEFRKGGESALMKFTSNCTAFAGSHTRTGNFSQGATPAGLEPRYAGK